MKKLLSMVLAVVMLLGVFTVGIGAWNFNQDFVNDQTFQLGNVDASEDGVNAIDLFTLKSYAKGTAVTIDTNAADLEADGMINTSDMFYLKKIMTGSIDVASLGDNNQTAVFKIAGKNISEYALVVPIGHGSDKNTHYAAEIMQAYVKKATGVDLTIVNDGTWTGPAITFTKYSPVSEEGKEYGTEGYRYEVVDGNLNIYGTYRGNMYAVYEILEDFLGVRFFDDKYTFMYKQRYVEMEEGLERFFEPVVKFRFCGPKLSYGHAVECYYYPSRLNGTQIYSYSEERYGLQYGPQHVNAHSFGLYWRYGTGTMPEDDGTMTLEQRYLALYNSGVQQDELAWQPCASSESEYQLMFNGMLTCMKRLENWNAPAYAFTTIAKEEVELGQKTMSFSLCDNEHYCTCRNCRNTMNGYTDRKTGIYYPPEGASGAYLILANRAVNELQEYYPGIRVHAILYNHAIPATVRPDKNLVVFYCGQGCNNHYIMNGAEECGDCKGQLNKESNKFTDESLRAWGEFCKESGAEMWYWYYGVTYHYYLADMPNVTNIYYDYKYLYEECNVRGFYYESGGRFYGYSALKAYMATKMSWDPTMTYEQYTDYVKEYLYMYYGDGYEKVYEYIMLMEEAGDKCGTCFVSNFDRPGDMLSYEFIAEKYEYLRQLVLDAYDMADDDIRRSRLETLRIMIEFIGLSSVHTDWYLNGDEASKALYEERYTWFYEALPRCGIEIFSDPKTYVIPSEIDFDENPMIQFYEQGSRRENVYP